MFMFELEEYVVVFSGICLCLCEAKNRYLYYEKDMLRFRYSHCYPSLALRYIDLSAH